MSGPGMHGNSAFVPGSLIAGKYRLIKNLGEGAMGVVWSAVNEVTLGEVALKLIWKPDPDYRVRLLREAKACGTVSHKNVIRIHDVGQTDGNDPFLVMELLTGETLAELLARKRRLSPPEAAAIGRDIARGLAAAHAKGIIHRDLKPANIFLHNQPGEDLPVVKVLDFGVAKNTSFNDGLRTAAGGTVGSPMYMSPEQAARDPNITTAADIWSLGVVLFEMLTGDRPFRGELAEVLHQILEGNIPTVGRRIRRIDPELDAIVAGCLTRDPRARLGPASEVANLLDDHADQGGREPLPSLVEEAFSDRSGPVPAAISPAVAGFSPSPSAIGFQPPSGPGFAASDARPSSSGHGRVAPSAPVSAPRGGLMDEDSDPATRPIDGPPAPWRKPQMLGAADDDADTHRMEPRMLPRPTLRMGDADMGPTGTVRIDPNVVEQAIAARGQAQPSAQVPPALAAPPAPAVASSLLVSPAGPAPIAMQGTTSSTAPILRAEPPIPHHLASARASNRKRDIQVIIAGFVVGVSILAIAAVLFFGRKRGTSTDSASTSGSASGAPVVAAASATTATATVTASTTPSVLPTATATASTTPSVLPTATATATASTTPSVQPTTPTTPKPPGATGASTVPKPTVKASPCKKFDIKCQKKTEFNKL